MDAAELTGQGAHLLADTDALIFALPELTALDVLMSWRGAPAIRGKTFG